LYGVDVDTKYQFIAVTKVGDLHEFVLGLSHPKWWPYWKIHALVRQSVKSPEGGFFQEIGLAPTFELPTFIEGVKEAINFDAKLVINHGAIGIDPGLTHTAFKVKLPISIGEWILAPEISHQVISGQFISEKPGNVNKHRHTTWGGVILTLRF
jgi:hypothetical protein